MAIGTITHDDEWDSSSQVFGTVALGIVLVVVAGWLSTQGLQVLPYTIAFAGILTLGYGLRQLSQTLDGLWKVLGVLVLLWLGFFILITAVPTLAEPPAGAGTLKNIVGITLFLIWIGVPIVLYMDAKRVSSMEDWSPWWPLYALPAIIPLINIVMSCLYLFRRHQKIGTP